MGITWGGFISSSIDKYQDIYVSVLVRLYLQIPVHMPGSGTPPVTLNVEKKGSNVEISGIIFFADVVETVRRRVEVETGTRTLLKYANPETLIRRLLQTLTLTGFEVSPTVPHRMGWKKKEYQVYLSDKYVGTIRYDGE